jgi:hypothetical protein
MSRVARLDHPIDVVRPFAWVAVTAFAAGFWGYMAYARLGGG